jgi:hypothetical protein
VPVGHSLASAPRYGGGTLPVLARRANIAMDTASFSERSNQNGSRAAVATGAINLGSPESGASSLVGCALTAHSVRAVGNTAARERVRQDIGHQGMPLRRTPARSNQRRLPSATLAMFAPPILQEEPTKPFDRAGFNTVISSDPTK